MVRSRKALLSSVRMSDFGGPALGQWSWRASLTFLFPWLQSLRRRQTCWAFTCPWPGAFVSTSEDKNLLASEWISGKHQHIIHATQGCARSSACWVPDAYVALPRCPRGILAPGSSDSRWAGESASPRPVAMGALPGPALRFPDSPCQALEQG